MRIDIVLDDELVREAQRLTGIRTERELVEEALRSLIETRRRLELLDLWGRVELAEGYDHRPLRAITTWRSQTAR
ncbi:MAG TPA: type II toxin-antitoxin system VapB family antitoxin [Thermopetrobacter sp.]|nr:type II toxin-antitoxin system VapB family antitoxin [Thermopetrobacter sp.]